MVTAVELLEAISQMLTIGADEAIANLERSQGFQVIRPGDAPFFPADDWHPGSVCSLTADGCCRIVLVDATNPGTGAFRRMVQRIIIAGLFPRVVEPGPHMLAILRHWNWILIPAPEGQARVYAPPPDFKIPVIP